MPVVCTPISPRSPSCPPPSHVTYDYPTTLTPFMLHMTTLPHSHPSYCVYPSAETSAPSPALPMLPPHCWRPCCGTALRRQRCCWPRVQPSTTRGQSEYSVHVHVGGSVA